MIRTVAEKSAFDIFLNSTAVQQIAGAAAKTTEAKPILPMSEEEYWHFLNPVLNAVSKQFSEGLMQRAMGMPFTRETFVFCLTNECAGSVKTRKIRAVMIKKYLLENLPEKAPNLEHEFHETRWETLNKMAAEYSTKPFQFMDVEICL